MDRHAVDGSRHHLDLRLLMWLCCPLEWWYESDSEGEEERIRRPVLRTLHETFISSRAFTAMCFPCPMSRRYWTLLHAVCSYLRRSQTTHTCDSSPCGEHAWHLFRWAHGPWLWNEITEEWFLSIIRQQNGNAISFATNKDVMFIGGFLASVGFLSR